GPWTGPWTSKKSAGNSRRPISGLTEPDRLPALSVDVDCPGRRDIARRDVTTLRVNACSLGGQAVQTTPCPPLCPHGRMELFVTLRRAVPHLTLRAPKLSV